MRLLTAIRSLKLVPRFFLTEASWDWVIGLPFTVTIFSSADAKLFKKILILNEKKHIDIYYLLSHLYLTIEKCPSIVLYIKYIIKEDKIKHIEEISNYFFTNRNQNDSTWDYYFDNPRGNPIEKTNLMISILIFYEFDGGEAENFINRYIGERMKWTHLEEAIKLFQKYKNEKKENIYKFINSKLSLKIVNNL